MYNPYTSEASNVYNENEYNTVPTTFGQNNLLVNQGTQRSIFDATTTSIVPNMYAPQQPQAPNFYMGGPNYNTPLEQPASNRQYQQYQYPRRDMVPNGVSYTFQPPAQNYDQRYFENPPQQPIQNPCNTSNLQYHIALKELEKHCLENMLLHEQLKRNPYMLQFTQNVQTSTDDLNSYTSRGLSDFSSTMQRDFPTPLYGDIKPLQRRLFLKEQPPSTPRDVDLSVLDCPRNNLQASVSCPPLIEERETQVNIPCKCQQQGIPPNGADDGAPRRDLGANFEFCKGENSRPSNNPHSEIKYCRFEDANARPSNNLHSEMRHCRFEDANARPSNNLHSEMKYGRFEDDANNQPIRESDHDDKKVASIREEDNYRQRPSRSVSFEENTPPSSTASVDGYQTVDSATSSDNDEIFESLKDLNLQSLASSKENADIDTQWNDDVSGIKNKESRRSLRDEPDKKRKHGSHSSVGRRTSKNSKRESKRQNSFD